MKYIFVAGAPGSKWSGVVKNVYFSSDIDRSDHNDQHNYRHGKPSSLHLGAYWDPGMEFGNFFDQLDQYTKEQCEHEFDRPFSGTGIRIIKSHVFAHHVDTIRERWPDCAIVLIHRSNDACLDWWVKSGGFDITYPSYHGYYKDLPTMSRIIGEQNASIESAINHHSGPEPKNNHELSQILGLTLPPDQGTHDYDMSDIKVKVLVPTKHSPEHGDQMILPDLILHSRVNQCWQFSGLDSAENCINKKHFASYPHAVSYCYNSRGFRDQEWSDSIEELRNAIWCIGDSYTVGIGSPVAHTWPSQLQKLINRRVINVSMDGASNEWIARVAENIIQSVGSVCMVIMWSHTHRREHDNVALSHEDRRLHCSPTLRFRPESDDWQNFLDCKNRIDTISSNTIQFAIPNFHPYHARAHSNWNQIRGSDWPNTVPGTLAEWNLLPSWILLEIKDLHQCLDTFQTELSYCNTVKVRHQHSIMLVDQKDLARDGYHFDSITADWVARQAADQLPLLNSGL